MNPGLDIHIYREVQIREAGGYGVCFGSTKSEAQHAPSLSSHGSMLLRSFP